MRMPPSEVIVHGTDCIFRYLQLVSQSRLSKHILLSRLSFWMFEMQDATQRFYVWPDELSSYVHLQGINLSGNFLLTIPPSVSRLTELRDLDLEQNRLRTLPEELAFCSNLEHIMVLRNPDLRVPSREVTSKGSSAILAFLRCLHSAGQRDTIAFNGSSYRRVPAELMKYHNVTDLSVAGNAIEICPAEIEDMINLTALDFDNNQLAMLPEEICGLTSLRRLGFANNIVVAVPDLITQLVNLEELRSQGNFSFDAPKEVCVCVSMPMPVPACVWLCAVWSDDVALDWRQIRSLGTL